MAAITDFPKRVVIVLAHAIKHLSAFSIAEAFLETKFFSKFTTKVHMLLNGNTLTNLSVIHHPDILHAYLWIISEIYRNGTDHSSRGSLMWILDHTKTKFGARLLKSWVGRPLVDTVYVYFVLLLITFGRLILLGYCKIVSMR
jgi:DNA mismatch repair protein MSH3